MSCFMVGPDHLNTLVVAWMQYGDRASWSNGKGRRVGFSLGMDPESEAAAWLGNEQAWRSEDSLLRMLAFANRRSVQDRYRGKVDDMVPTDAEIEATRCAWFNQRVEVGAALKALDCYVYQSCDADDWKESEAHSFCEMLRLTLATKVPGYESAPWGIAGGRDYGDPIPSQPVRL